MKVIRGVAAMQLLSRQLRRNQWKIAFVPTMGALHEGHMALVQRAKKLVGHHGKIVVSLFVNPTQFNSRSDFQHYPKTLTADLKKLKGCHVDFAFIPTTAAMYPKGAETTMEVGSLAQHLCGKSRPGHFRGVATVVTKLFHIVQPDIAIFGEKDFQQLAIIRQMVQNLNFPIKIIGHPTVRESDGLAMSSRNSRLSAAGRVKARCLFQALREAQRLVKSGVRETISLKRRAQQIIGGNGKIDYIEIVDEQTLQPVKKITGRCRMALAVWIDGVRLIDSNYSGPHQ